METVAVDEKLIELVCTFSCLWQVSMAAYKDIKVKENVWRDIKLKVFT